MPKSCIVCSAVASPDLQLQYCAVCQSALYCSQACQRKDWKKQHKNICKLLNVGHGDMQVRTKVHTTRSIQNKEAFERTESMLNEDMKRFFKLFTESTREESRAAKQEMKKIAARQIKQNQKSMLFHSLYFLAHSDKKKLRWPNSPLLVMLHFVDSNVLSGDEESELEAGGARVTPLHHLADLAEPSDYSTHVNQLILAKQLIEHGANVNAVSRPYLKTPLDNACFTGNVTNLDFVELLLEEGAHPNAQDYLGFTPLMATKKLAPGAAKFLLNWPTTDVNITTRTGATYLTMVRSLVHSFSELLIAFPDHPDIAKHQFWLQQWRGIEEMLVERGAHDPGITEYH
jgi:hypothetical protein